MASPVSTVSRKRRQFAHCLQHFVIGCVHLTRNTETLLLVHHVVQRQGRQEPSSLRSRFGCCTRVRAVRWDIMSRGVMDAEPYSSATRHAALASRAGASKFSLPSCTICSATIAVKALVLDATWYSVCSVAGVPACASAKPTPPTNTTLWLQTTPTLRPVTLKSSAA